MTYPRLVIACAALLAVFACFAAPAQDAPFIGVVTDNKVEVRSGAGRAYYVVGELKKGDMARVEKVLFNQTWYQVRVPSGIYSYVSKAFVDAQGDGETGTINADRTEFKAASLRGPGESYRVQGTLTKDTKVTIIGEEGNFYKIASPQDAFVFIPAGTLRKATAQDLEAAGEGSEEKPDPATTDPKPEPVEPVPPVVVPVPEPVTPEPEAETPQPEVESPVPPVVEPVDPVTPTPEPVTPQPEPEDTGTPPIVTDTDDGWPAAPQVKVTTPARSDALQQLERKVLPYFSLPVTDQPLDLMAKAYQDLQARGELPGIDEQIVTVRLRTIERRQEILDTLAQAEAAENKEYARTVVPEERATDTLPTRYTAVGLLQPSTVYDGKSLPLLYRVVDAAPSGRTLAYVAPSDEINLAGMLNQLVGIVGQTTYNRALKLQVIEIDRAVLLEAEPAEPEAEEQAVEESAE